MPADLSDWLENHVVHINKTMRPYLKQSILLVNAARSIQDQYRSPATDSDLKVTIQCVSNALKAARDPVVRHKRTNHVDDAFENANREVRKFCAKYDIKITLSEDMDELSKEDRKATSHLHAAKRFAEKAVKVVGSKGSTKFLVTFWHPEQNERTLEFTVENGTKLDHLLVRILQKSLEKKNGLPRVNLIQNPGFFPTIPSTLKDFSEGNRGRLTTRHKHQSKQTLCQLDLQDKIDDRRLYLLLDPPVLPESGLTIFDTEKQKDIKRNYRNIWRLDERDAYAAAREISGCLVRLDPTKPLPLPVRPESAPPQPIPPQRRPPQRPEPTRETPRHPTPLPPIEPIHPPPPPREPQKLPAKTGFFDKFIPQALKWTDPSPPKPEPPPLDPEPTSEVYLSRNFMGPIRLEMVGVELPKKKKGWWGRS